jgi:hypothetical protein
LVLLVVEAVEPVEALPELLAMAAALDLQAALVPVLTAVQTLVAAAVALALVGRVALMVVLVAVVASPSATKAHKRPLAAPSRRQPLMGRHTPSTSSPLLAPLRLPVNRNGPLCRTR